MRIVKYRIRNYKAITDIIIKLNYSINPIIGVNKLDLISKLTASIKSDIASKNSSLHKAFGAFESEKSTEEIITEIRCSRNFTR